MTQRDLNRAVARATGEDLDEIRRHGFSIVVPDDEDLDDECASSQCDLAPQIINWDDHYLRRNVAVVDQRRFARAA